MVEFSVISLETGKDISGVPAYQQAIDTLLRTPPGEEPTDPAQGFRVLETFEGRIRSRAGLTPADVAASAEETILRDVPGIVVADIEPEMTAEHGVSAINVRFQIIETGAIGEVRVEIPY